MNISSETNPAHNTKKEEEERVPLTPMFITFAVVTVVWLLIGFLPWFAEKGWPWTLYPGLSDASKFADSFGFVNSLFSALAMAGVIVAILLQRLELAAQRKELRLTQTSLQETADANSASAKELAIQSRMNTNQALLASIQGMQEFAEIAVQSADSDTKKDGDILLKVVFQFRQLILLDILSNDSGDSSRRLIKERLSRWSNLTFLLESFRRLKELAAPIVQVSSTTTAPVKITKSIPDRKRYVSLVDEVNRRIESIGRALRATEQQPDEFGLWLATANKYVQNIDKKSDYDLVPSVENLTAQLNSCIQRMLEMKMQIGVS